MNKEELIELIKSKDFSEDEISDLVEYINNEVDDISDEELFNQRIEMIFTKINEFFNSDGVKNIMEYITSSKSSKQESELKLLKEKHEAGIRNKEKDFENLVDARKFLKYRYWQDIAMVGLICSAIIVLNFNGHLDKASTGTLMGAVIGYALGRFRNKTSEN